MGAGDWPLFSLSVGVGFVFAGHVEEGEFVDFEVGVVGCGPFVGSVRACHHVA